jgi:predicted RNase H-like nuclease
MLSGMVATDTASREQQGKAFHTAPYAAACARGHFQIEAVPATPEQH